MYAFTRTRIPMGLQIFNWGLSCCGVSIVGSDGWMGMGPEMGQTELIALTKLRPEVLLVSELV